MSFLVKEYKIPSLGKVELIKSTGYDKSFNGKYYAENGELGKFCRKCESVEELMEKVSSEIKNYIKNYVDGLEKRIIEEEEKKGKLESLLDKINTIKNESQEKCDWLKEYQTENPLQLEYQDAERQKRDKK